MIKETVLYSPENAGYILWQHKRGNCRYVIYVSRMNQSAQHAQLDRLKSMLSFQELLAKIQRNPIV